MAHSATKQDVSSYWENVMSNQTFVKALLDPVPEGHIAIIDCMGKRELGRRYVPIHEFLSGVPHEVSNNAIGMIQRGNLLIAVICGDMGIGVFPFQSRPIRTRESNIPT